MNEFRTERLALAANYAGRAVRFSFFLSGTFVFVLIASVILLIWSFLTPTITVKATPVLQITAPELSRLTATSRSTKFVGGWQEILQYGQTYSRDTDFVLSLMIPSDPTKPLPRDADQAIVRDAFSFIGPGSSGPLPRITPMYNQQVVYYDLETRFGPVRASNFQAQADGQIKLCVSYLSRLETTAVYFKGWYCEANGATPSYGAVACMLDHITLKGLLPTAEAQSFFEERIKRPSRCSASPVSQTTDTGTRRPLRTLSDSGTPWSRNLPRR